MRQPDYKIRLRYTLADGRRSARTCWRSQLHSAVRRNVARGILDTEWRAASRGLASNWKRA